MKFEIAEGAPSYIKGWMELEFKRIVDALNMRGCQYEVRFEFYNERPIRVPAFNMVRGLGFKIDYNGGETFDPENGVIVVRLNTFALEGDLVKYFGKDADGLSFKSSFRHEMGHVWQLVSGKLKKINGGEAVCWEGRKFGEFDDPGYWNRPWEVEARAIAQHFEKEGA